MYCASQNDIDGQIRAVSGMVRSCEPAWGSFRGIQTTCNKASARTVSWSFLNPLCEYRGPASGRMEGLCRKCVMACSIGRALRRWIVVGVIHVLGPANRWASCQAQRMDAGSESAVETRGLWLDRKGVDDRVVGHHLGRKRRG